MKIAVTGTSGRIGRAIHFALCRKLLAKAFKGAEAVVHTAALHAPHVGIYDDSEFFRINVEGTKSVFRAAIDCNVLKQTPEKVLRNKCHSICDLFAIRQWKLPESIDRVYDSSLAQRVLGWTPSYGFEEVTRLLDACIPEVLPA